MRRGVNRYNAECNCCQRHSKLNRVTAHRPILLIAREAAKSRDPEPGRFLLTE